MKVSAHIKHQNSDLNGDQKRVIDDFIKFLQKNIPLKNNISIVFLGDRVGEMTTGSRTSKKLLKILADDRMLIDVLRTLAHEWTHEYEHENMDLDYSVDIGGKAENIANIDAGVIVKMFQRDFPQYLGLLYQ